MFWEKFIFLCNQKGMSPNAVCAELGLSTAVATKWKNGAIPRSTTLAKIAEYFGVAKDYLLGKDDTAPVGGELTALDQSKVYRIPVFETASAGFGAYAADEIVDHIPMYIDSAAEAQRTICIRVKGNSMLPDIADGDIIRVCREDAVDSGTLAVVLIDDEGFVKFVEYGQGWIKLHSINPSYGVMHFTGSDVEHIRVVGRVVQIIKNSLPRMRSTAAAHPTEQARRDLFRELDHLDPGQLEAVSRIVDAFNRER